jgi:hypothetical protein
MADVLLPGVPCGGFRRSSHPGSTPRRIDLKPDPNPCSVAAVREAGNAQRGTAVGDFRFRRMFLLRQVSSVGVLRLEPLCIDESASACDL